MQDGQFKEPDGGMKEGPEAENPGVTNEFGIEETTDVVDSMVKVANGIKVTMEDGKFSPMEVFNFTGALMSLPAAITGAKFIPAELGNLSNEEIAILINNVQSNLEYASTEDAQVIINKALIAGLAIKALVEAIKDV